MKSKTPLVQVNVVNRRFGVRRCYPNLDEASKVIWWLWLYEGLRCDVVDSYCELARLLK